MKFNAVFLSMALAGLIAVAACAPKATSPAAQASASPEASCIAMAMSPKWSLRLQRQILQALTIEQKLDLLDTAQGKVWQW